MSWTEKERASRWTSRLPLVVAALVAVALLAGSFHLPVWRMTLEAPQYPKGLHLVAYGTRIEGDLREINIINHYVGMEKIQEVPAPEMSLFPAGVWFLILLSALAPFSRRVAWAAAAANVIVPLMILADLQFWLHKFGRSLDPSAPLRLDPFTPLALGSSHIGNFESTAMVSWGFLTMLGAAAALVVGLLAGRPRQAESSGSSSIAVAATVLLEGLLLASPGWPVTPPSLQERIDAVSPGGTLEIDGGVYRGPATIVGPMTVRGFGRPVIDGGGRGSVVEISGEGVVFSGFEVRHGGRSVSEEPAGIKVEGSRHRIEDNVVHDVYFGIHLARGEDLVVRGNHIEPGRGEGVRPGHSLSVWYVHGARIEGNFIARGRDGIYLSFADDIAVVDNEITASRYGIHSMYSERSRFRENHLHHNLLGAALMYSEGLIMRCNRIERHRAGATAYGVLLKDIDDLVLEDNRILDNRVGVYADNTPLGPGREAVVRRNLIAGNGAALALQSNVRLLFAENRVTDNLVEVRAEGAGLSAANRWSSDGRGNYWSAYRGYDGDQDGIGDLPFRHHQLMSQLMRRAPLAQAFVLTPAQVALEQAARMFPLVRPEPLLVDPHPLMAAVPVVCEEREG